MPNYRTTVIDHLNLAVSDLARSRAFYTPALAAIGIVELLSFGAADGTESGGQILGYGFDHKPFFWLIEGKRIGEHTHVAFAVDKRADVIAFHRAALAAGGTDHGAPGIRSKYHENYYGAFVLDPDGINVEAVCHAPE